MSLTKLLPVILLMMATGVQASTRDEIERPDVMQTFFPNIPVATPTTFLVNVNTLEALPLLQGATDAAGFMARMDTVLQMYANKITQ